MLSAGRGVHYIGHGKEFQAAYARAMLNDKVKIWGGHDASFTETAPPYKFCTPEAEDHIFENGYVRCLFASKANVLPLPARRLLLFTCTLFFFLFLIMCESFF